MSQLLQCLLCSNAHHFPQLSTPLTSIIIYHSYHHSPQPQHINHMTNQDISPAQKVIPNINSKSHLAFSTACDFLAFYWTSECATFHKEPKSINFNHFLKKIWCSSTKSTTPFGPTKNYLGNSTHYLRYLKVIIWSKKSRKLRIRKCWTIIMLIGGKSWFCSNKSAFIWAT